MTDQITELENNRPGRKAVGPVFSIRSFHSIHNVVDRGILQAMWEELPGKVGYRDQLIIC